LAESFAVNRRDLPETEFKNLAKVYTAGKQNRDPGRCNLRPVNGIDTEATKEAELFLVADSDGRYLDRDISADSIIDFLLHKKYQNAYNVSYNVHYDAIMILKQLGDELKVYKETRMLEFKWRDGTMIKYIPKKCLTIKRGHHSTSIFDVAQFYGTSLLDAYERYIGPVPTWYKEVKASRDVFSHRFYRRNTTLVRKYCTMDAFMAKRLDENWLSLFHTATGFYPKRQLSGAYLVCKAMINRGIPFPRFSAVPYPAQSLAYRCAFGGRFEQFKRGFIGDAYNYDINSAYPDKIAKLPDLEDGIWVSSTHIEPTAKLGFFKIAADVPDDTYVTPFLFKAPGKVLFPSGKFITYSTIDELRACTNPDYYKIIESWQFIPNDKNYCPYREFILDMYAKKSELKDGPMYLPFKIMLNSVFGKSGETISRRRCKIMGNFFNPTIFAYIPGATRAQLYRYIIENRLEKDIVYTATDSICTTRDIGIDSQRLGEFAFKDHADDVFCIQNGINRWHGKFRARSRQDEW
jgi:hypothetical protein